ncbi:ubiquitin domain-containing protein [Gigaspora margarita]|uniref:Ubiquitin domain-containing protein n=1 Tax=Gigaspora margarita TaxID=4874 RepID=A0A8H4A1I6_GIGMA|nr:ubiquitin domain-containing protein [Gigaspora margarita]
MLGIDIKKISLSFSGKPLEDHRTLESYNIKQNDTIHVSRRIIGGAFDYFVLTNDYLDPRYDNDFSNQQDGPALKRGNEPYKPPYEWKRLQLILKVCKDAAENIAKDGFDLLKGKRFLYGKGIYSTPDVKEAECYAKQFSFKIVDIKWITADDKNIRPYSICIKKI